MPAGKKHESGKILGFRVKERIPHPSSVTNQLRDSKQVTNLSEPISYPVSEG